MKFDIVRVWKDESYRQSLSNEQLSQFPENPAGAIELTDTELESVFGGGGYEGWQNTGSNNSCHNNGCGNNGWGNSGCHNNGWGSNGNRNNQHNSNICSIICSHDCDINILDLLNLHVL
jgi:mersacidin/lichenicidin family type 2 lantibiotic